MSWWRRFWARLLGRQAPQDLVGALATLRADYRRRTRAELVRAYSEVPWLRAVVSRIATAVASVQFDVLVEGRVQPEHPLRALLDAPTGGLTGWTRRMLTQVYLELTGEAVWVLARNEDGLPVEAWVLPPHWVTDLDDEKVIVQAPTGRVTFERRNTVLFRDPDPDRPYGRGSGVTHALVDELAADEYAAQFIARFFSNAARPDMLVSLPGVSPDTLARVREEWEARTQGLHNAFRAHFLNAEAKVTVLEPNLSHLQFTELRRFERDLVHQVFGVPPEILGVVESSNRATIQAAGDLFGRWVIKPRIALWEAVVNGYLAPQYGTGVAVKWHDAVPRDLEFQLRQSTEGLRSGALTINEWRERNGWPPLEDGDRLLVPLNTAPEPADVASAEAVRALFDAARRRIKDRPDEALKIVQKLQRQVLEVLQ